MKRGGWSFVVAPMLVVSTMCGQSRHDGSDAPETQAGGGGAGAGGDVTTGGSAGAPDGQGGVAGAGGATAGESGSAGAGEAGAAGAGDPIPPKDPPGISTEGSVPGPLGDGVRNLQESALAWGDGVYFLVWSDPSGAGQMNILGARFSEAGSRLDSRPILIGVGAGDKEGPSVAFNGEAFLVTWAEFRGAERRGHTSVLGARVTPAGVVLDADPIRIIDDGYQHSVAPRAPGWLVAGLHWINEIRPLEVMRVDRGGAVGVEREHEFTRYASDLAFETGADSSLALVRLDYTPNGSRLSALLFENGASSPSSTTIATPYGYSDVVWDGSAYYFGWLDNQDLSVTLERLAPDGGRTSLPFPELDGYFSITASTSTLLLAYNVPEGSVYSARARPFTTPDLAPGPEVTLAPASEGTFVDAAARGSSGFGLVLGTSELALLDDTATTVVGRSEPAPLAEPPQRQPAAAADSTGFALAWAESSATGHAVRLARFDPTGILLDNVPIEIGSGASPAVARRAGETLVVWANGGDVLGRRVDSTGMVAATQTLAQRQDHGVLGYTSFGSPSVAALETGYVVSLIVYPPELMPPMVATRGIDGAIVPQPPNPNTRPTGFASRSALAAVAGGHALAFASTASGEELPLRLELVTGGVARTLGVAGGWQPSLASSGDRVLVAWEDGSVDDAVIRAAVHDVASGERLGDIIDLTSAGDLAHGVTAAFDGRRFLVAWKQLGETGNDVYAARIETTGQRYDPVPFRLPVPEHRREGPVLVGGAMSVLCAYTRLVEPSAATSVKLLWLSE